MKRKSCQSSCTSRLWLVEILILASSVDLHNHIDDPLTLQLLPLVLTLLNTCMDCVYKQLISAYFVQLIAPNLKICNAGHPP